MPEPLNQKAKTLNPKMPEPYNPNPGILSKALRPWIQILAWILNRPSLKSEELNLWIKDEWFKDWCDTEHGLGFDIEEVLETPMIRTP